MDNPFFVSTDKSQLDLPMIHEFLSKRSYWAKDRTIDAVQRSIDNSLCFGVYTGSGKQVGFGRVVTDYTIFGWLMDVFITETHRGHGLGKMLLQAVMSHPELQTLKRWGLVTKDAHSLYEKAGFVVVENPERMMEKLG
ncbi:GNAT family N-acetyltransferase [Chitinophaga sp. LS1]|uniref:GNAT family N-acetyltransferase n=1 Tax=Chitinophaga sp. LS1 TaxID=3051176 RepID=UPI002AAB7DA3|nr:GNAT family N-acetyltransferase [Chitinophaga sp. LS1]WPV63861.1 GNAT family N-acetyltransferase [Chitinophaga sp. LS1]